MSSEIKVGQVWREVDPRRERFVRVYDIFSASRTVVIETVDFAFAPGTATTLSTKSWKRVKGAPLREAKVERFNGKRGGYVLHQDVE